MFAFILEAVPLGFRCSTLGLSKSLNNSALLDSTVHHKADGFGS